VRGNAVGIDPAPGFRTTRFVKFVGAGRDRLVAKFGPTLNLICQTFPMLLNGDGSIGHSGVEYFLVIPVAGMKNVLLASVLGGVVASGAAMAAEKAPVRAPYKAVPTKLYNWEGLYLGANGGYGWGSDSSLDPGASGTQTGVFLDGPAQLAAQLA